MNDDNQLVVAVKSALERNQTLSRAELILVTESALGRKLRPIEASIAIWQARDAYMREHAKEIISKRGKFSTATVEQSINRRANERSKALRTLAKSAERSAILADSTEISDENRRTLLMAAEKANTMLVNATVAARKKRKLDGV